jgi:hypothetical protein
MFKFAFCKCLPLDIPEVLTTIPVAGALLFYQGRRFAYGPKAGTRSPRSPEKKTLESLWLFFWKDEIRSGWLVTLIYGIYGFQHSCFACFGGFIVGGFWDVSINIVNIVNICENLEIVSWKNIDSDFRDLYTSIVLSIVIFKSQWIKKHGTKAYLSWAPFFRWQKIKKSPAAGGGDVDLRPDLLHVPIGSYRIMVLGWFPWSFGNLFQNVQCPDQSFSKFSVGFKFILECFIYVFNPKYGLFS